MRRQVIGGLTAAMLASPAWAQDAVDFCFKNNGGYVARVTMYREWDRTSEPREFLRKDYTVGNGVCAVSAANGVFRIKIEALGAIASEVNVMDQTFRAGATYSLISRNIQAMGTIFDTQWGYYK